MRPWVVLLSVVLLVLLLLVLVLLPARVLMKLLRSGQIVKV
jgi:hypothetical protein